jgi:hypothetical protein
MMAARYARREFPDMNLTSYQGDATLWCNSYVGSVHNGKLECLPDSTMAAMLVNGTLVHPALPLCRGDVGSRSEAVRVE